MIKLSLTHSFSGSDIKDAANPEALYVANVHWVRDASIDFIRSDYQDIDLALKTLDEILISVSFNGTDYPVSLDWLKEFKDSIEEQNPGMSKWYMLSLARSIVNYQWLYQDERLKNSQAPLPVSANGNGKKKQKLAGKQ